MDITLSIEDDELAKEFDSFRKSAGNDSEAIGTLMSYAEIVSRYDMLGNILGDVMFRISRLEDKVLISKDIGGRRIKMTLGGKEVPQKQ
jgi:hypothetical protein